MMKQENGLGHQLGTYTTALITSLFFNLTFVDSPFFDHSTSGVNGAIWSCPHKSGLSFLAVQQCRSPCTQFLSLAFRWIYIYACFSVLHSGVHGHYPGIAAFTGLQQGELLVKDITETVDRVIEVTSMPVTPTSTDLKVIYEPLRITFEETYGDACNVLFKVIGGRVRGRRGVRHVTNLARQRLLYSRFLLLLLLLLLFTATRIL